MIILSHPTGNSFVRQALSAFAEGSWEDYRFYTTLAWPRNWDYCPLSKKVFSRRSYPVPMRHIRTHPWREILRLLSPWPHAAWNVDAVYRSLDQKVARALPRLKRKHAVDTVYAYEDGAYHTFEVAQDLGIRRIYDLPIGYHAAAQALYQEEAQLMPQWAGTIPGLHDAPEKLQRKARELELADKVVVASTFTASTLRGVVSNPTKMQIIPYGAPDPQPFYKRSTNRPLKVLYVGSLTQRKGLSYLFDAVAPFKDRMTLTLIGRKVGNCRALDQALGQHQYFPSLPHAEILEQMRHHDLLVFPSLFEGFGLVLTEALSCGLPIIATAHTAAPDLITDKKEGFIIPIRDSQAIAQKFEWALDNPDGLAAMQHAAWELSKRLSWESYRKSLIDLLYAT